MMDGLLFGGAIVLAIGILWKSADWFVEGAVGIAERLGVSPMFIGIVLVSIVTTSPELITSLLAALQDAPEIALGNAVGSVIINETIALGLGAVLAATPLLAEPRLLKTSGIFLVTVCALAFVLVFDGTLARWEGALLVAMFIGYCAFSLWDHKRHHAEEPPAEVKETLRAVEAHLQHMSTPAILGLFIGGFAGVLLGSYLLLWGARGYGEMFGVPDFVMGLTVVAIGTSIPEVATVVASSLKGKSGVGIGTIIGSDILNICWVAGLSATANPLVASRTIVFISFPCMLVIVVSMLLMLRMGYKLTRVNGFILVSLYAVYLAVLFLLVPREQLPMMVH